MPITNRNLAPGTKLIATYKKETYHAVVVAGEDGKARYQLVPYDGKEYKSPSSLGTAVTGKSCNGWAFWSVDTGEAETTPIAQEANATTAQEPPAEQDAGKETGDADAPNGETEEDSQPQTTDADPDSEFPEATDRPRFHRVPNQKGVDPGQVRLHCYSCRSSFIVPDDKNPDTCPMGHEPV